MNIRVFWYAVLLLGVCRLSAASYSYGDWNWEVSDYSGSVSKLCYQGELIVSSFYFGLQTEQKLVNHFTGKAVSLKGNVLTLTHREAPWTIRQIFTFDASGRKGLLERTYELVLDAGESKERKFKDIVSLPISQRKESTTSLPFRWDMADRETRGHLSRRGIVF